MSAPDRYELSTLAEVIDLHGKLPADRQEILLREVGQWLDMACGLATISRAFGMAAKTQPMVWINDTKGEATINVSTTEGEKLVSATVSLNHAVASVHAAAPQPITDADLFQECP